MEALYNSSPATPTGSNLTHSRVNPTNQVLVLEGNPSMAGIRSLVL